MAIGQIEYIIFSERKCVENRMHKMLDSSFRISKSELWCRSGRMEIFPPFEFVAKSLYRHCPFIYFAAVSICVARSIDLNVADSKYDGHVMVHSPCVRVYCLNAYSLF